MATSLYGNFKEMERLAEIAIDERDHYKAQLDSLVKGIGEEVERLREKAARLKQTETDPRFGDAIVAQAHAARMYCEEAADRLTTLLDQHQGGES